MNILLAHGSPGDAHGAALTELAAAVSAQLGEEVGTAFLGDELPKQARVVPLFLTHGRHLRHDVPAVIEASGASLLKGPADFPTDMAAMAFELAMEAKVRQRAVMFALYRLTGAAALMTELYERSQKFSLPAIAALHGQSDAASVLRLWREEELKAALVQPVLLFPGHSLDGLHDVAGSSGLDVAIGPVLCNHPGFAAWLAGRFKEKG